MVRSCPRFSLVISIFIFLFQYTICVVNGTGSMFLFRYRLAPEYTFPAAFDDCEKATRYFLKHSTEFDVDPKRVAVAGWLKFY